jgi:hypothetical protein
MAFGDLFKKRPNAAPKTSCCTRPIGNLSGTSKPVKTVRPVVRPRPPAR